MSSLVTLIERACLGIQGFQQGRKAKVPAGPSGTAFILGQDVDTDELIGLSAQDFSRHFYVTGATGTGKTNLLLRLIDHLVERGQTICLMDLRGDLVDRVLARLAAAQHGDDLPGRLCLIDLRDEALVPPFNPLVGPGSVHARAYGILGAFRSKAESWGVQLDEVLRNSLIALASSKGTLCQLSELLVSEDARSRILGHAQDPMVKDFFGRYDQLSKQMQNTLVSPALNKVTPFLALPVLRRMLCAPSGISFQSLFETPGRVILIALAAHRLKEAGHLAGSLFLTAVEEALLGRADQQEAGRRPLYLIIDEFENLACESFATLVAEGRRYGAHLTLAHQNLGQLPKSLQESIRNNIHLQLFFQTGADDAVVLAREVSGFGKKESVKDLLTCLPVGEALFTERSQATRRVRTVLADDADAAGGAIDSLRRRAARDWKALHEAGLPARPSKQEKREIRHARPPRF